jgi:hypothetical protein
LHRAAAGQAWPGSPELQSFSHNGRTGHSWLLLRAGYGSFGAMGFHRRHTWPTGHTGGCQVHSTREISSEVGKLEIQDPYLTHYMGINSKRTKDICIEPESINLLKMGKFHDTGLSNIVWM